MSELKDLSEKVGKNTSDIALIRKDIAEVIPMKMEQVVSNQFKQYKKEKAEIREALEKKAANSKGFWAGLDYRLKGALVTVLVTGGYSLIKLVDIAGAALKAKFGLQ